MADLLVGCKLHELLKDNLSTVTKILKNRTLLDSPTCLNKNSEDIHKN
jgi:hypothetical protein